MLEHAAYCWLAMEQMPGLVEVEVFATGQIAKFVTCLQLATAGQMVKPVAY